MCVFLTVARDLMMQESNIIRCGCKRKGKCPKVNENFPESLGGGVLFREQEA